MNLFLLIFFIIIGIAGLYFKVETGVFVGLGLIPWQVIRMKKSKKMNLLAIIITGIAGSIFFALIREWVLLGLFIFIEFYNYWGHTRTKTEA